MSERRHRRAGAGAASGAPVKRDRRPDYLKAFVESLVNWDYVAELYSKAV